MCARKGAKLESMASAVPTGSTAGSFKDELTKLKAHAGTWTLQQDATLKAAMEAFAAKTKKRMDDCLFSVEEFGNELDCAHVRLSHASNTLYALSQTQFIEHRVAADPEEEEPAAAPTAEPPPKKELTEDEQQAKMMAECKALVMAGLDAMAMYPMPEDLDDDDDDGRNLNGNGADDGDGVYYRPDPTKIKPDYGFIDRPLPFVIGTPEFLADDTCGLYDPEARETIRTTADGGTLDGMEEEDDDDDDDDDESDDEAPAKTGGAGGGGGEQRGGG